MIRIEEPHPSIRLRVADLVIRLDSSIKRPLLKFSGCHSKFSYSKAGDDDLTLKVLDKPLLGTDHWRSVFYDEETWKLWLDDHGRYIYVAPKHSTPKRQLILDPSFRKGELLGEFSKHLTTSRGIYPLRDMDMVLFINWLARYGDFIVHASGFEIDGEGYCFVGPSGAGKSTIAAHAAKKDSTTILGEDQVILRYRGDHFLVYGTPWHTDPAYCSPGGVPLKKMFFLDRNAEDEVAPCTPNTGIETLLRDAFIPYYNHEGVANILNGLDQLASHIPFFKLNYRFGKDIHSLIREIA